MYISIMGTIGGGKTTMTIKLAKRLGYKIYKEKVEDNRYLKLFYSDMKRYSFQTEMNMLYNRWTQQEKIGPKSVQDRTIYEDLIFANILKNSGLMTKNDYDTYKEFYDKVIGTLKYPDVIIYLKVSPQIALERIRKRGRKMEAGITIEYLRKLELEYNKLYKALSDKTKVIVVEELELEKGVKYILGKLI